MKALFGTDGIRGEAGQFPLDPATVTAIGFSLASHLAASGAKPKIITGRDTRESGAWIEQALIDGASRAGAECLSAGVITTPGVAFVTRKEHASAGVVISASHNPYHDNGIKIFAPSGRKMDDAVERQIESDIFSKIEMPAASSIDRSHASEEKLHEEYLSFLADEIGDGLELDGLKIVVTAPTAPVPRSRRRSSSGSMRT